MGGLIRDAYYGSRWIGSARKIHCKRTKKRLEVLKNELDKRAIKLNYMKLDRCDHAKKYS